jgi:polar amino acid transport system substrate-binding protein
MDKRSLLRCAVSLTLMMASFSIAEARNLKEIKDAGTLVIATNPNYPPQSFMGKEGKLEGFDVDVGEEVGKRIGVAVSFVTPQWDLMTAGNWGGRWDVAIASMAPTEKRAAVLDFPAVYYFEQAVAAIHKDSPFKSIKDLSGKAIGVTGGTLYEDYLNKKLSLKFADNIKFSAEFDYLIDDAKVVAYEDEAVSMDDLKLGDGVRLNAMLSSKVAVQTAIANGYPFRMLDQVIFSLPQAVAVENDNTELGDAVAKAISDMRADGTLSKLSLKWHKADLTNPN